MLPPRPLPRHLSPSPGAARASPHEMAMEVEDAEAGSFGCAGSWNKGAVLGTYVVLDGEPINRD